jgi:hypothetical protein
MLRSMRIPLLLLLMVAGASADRVFALGFGGYAYGGGGPVEGSYDFDGGPDLDMDGGTLHRGWGFVMEVHPAGRSIFNYRLNMGFEKFHACFDFEDTSPTFGPDFDAVGVAMDHTFGFAVLRHDVARLWIGPTVRLGFYAGEGDIDEVGVDGDFVVAEAGVGAAFGANFHIGHRFTISPSIGYRRSAYAGINDDNDFTDELTATGNTAYVKLSLMARTGSDAK